MVIRGEIAEIIGKYTVVLNMGHQVGVKKGMKFVIYAEGQHIIDSHGNDLGPLEIPKAELIITDVQDRLSIAENTEVREIPTVLDPYQAMRVREPLQVKEIEVRNMKIDKTIVKGDKVRQVF